MRRFLATVGLVALIVFVLWLSGWDVQQFLDEVARQADLPRQQTTDREEVPQAPTLPTPAPTVTGGDTIKLASFNIQVFGTSKLSKPHVMDVLAQVVRQFDVVAVQEVRAKDQTVVPQFVELINADGAQYDHVLGPRLGRTVSKEQYAFIYDTSRVELDRGSVETAPDPQDLLHREPLIAQFRIRGPPADQAFSFKLINIHTDPDDTDVELDALDDVFVAVQQDGSGEDDVILLGDLNVDEYHLGELGALPGIGYAISGVPTNTRRNKAYDNIVFHRPSTLEFVGTTGVLDLMAQFGLTEAQALEVSDHMPVWAEFSAFESTVAGPVAARPTVVPR